MYRAVAATFAADDSVEAPAALVERARGIFPARAAAAPLAEWFARLESAIAAAHGDGDAFVPPALGARPVDRGETGERGKARAAPETCYGARAITRKVPPQWPKRRALRSSL